MVKELQRKIDETQYWDLRILDFQIDYFGDEVNIFIYNDEVTSWRISFSSCYRVEYQTDANWRTITHVSDMRKAQLGYYGQDITLTQNKSLDDFYDVKIDLTILTAKVTCKKINVEKVSNSLVDIFWQ